jgi:hypothetical protein
MYHKESGQWRVYSKNHGEIGCILGTIKFQSCPQVLGNFLASWWGIETTIAHIALFGGASQGLNQAIEVEVPPEK